MADRLPNFHTVQCKIVIFSPLLFCIGDVVLRPRITDEELEFVRHAIRYELEDISLRPDQEPLLVEAIHAAAFKGNTLGLPKICPEENIDSISRQTLMSYLRSYHTPDRMVVAGVGVDHDELVEFTQKHFVNEKPIWGTDTSKVHVDKSVAQYTGGLVTIDKDLSNASLGPTPMPELAHLVIGKCKEYRVPLSISVNSTKMLI